MVAFALALVGGADAADAQILERLGAGNGVVRFTHPLRPDVRICERGIHTGPGWERGREGLCHDGEADVEIELAEGRAMSVRVLRPDDTPDPQARDLGRVTGEEAAAALLRFARLAPAAVAEDAIVVAVVADATEIWPELLDLARDRERPGRVRRSAVFWLGQEAAEAVTPELAATASASDEDTDIREAAVFALSQRPAAEGVPALMELARSAPHADTRKSALFWLAQSEDPRVPEFFGELLRGPA